MRGALKESFVPILGVLGLLFLSLLYVRYQVGLEAGEVTVITINTPVAEGVDDSLPEQEISSFGAADEQLDEIRALIGERKWQQSEQRLLALIKKRNDSITLATLGQMRYRQHRYDDALVYLNSASEKSPIWPGLYFYRALVNTQLNEPQAAEADYRRLIAIKPNHFEAHYNLGLLLMRQQQLPEAVSVLQQATNLAGGARRARAHYQLGRAWLAQGESRRTNAVEHFNLAIRFLPAFVEPRLALAEMEPDTEEGNESAERQLLTILELSPGHPSALFALAQRYTDRNERQAAITRYRELLQFDPQHSAGHYNLGLLLVREKQWEEAWRHFDWVVQHEPQNVKALFNRGRAAYRNKQFQDALADYQLALSLEKGNYPEVLLNMGLVQTSLKEYAAAEKSYRQAIAQKEDYATAWYNLGLLHMRQRQTSDALEALKRAVSLRQDYALAWYNLGVLYGRDGQNDKAIAAYEQALILRPGYAEARLNLAVRWMRAGQPQRAIEHYRKALALDESYSSAWYNLALAYRDVKQHNEAVNALKKVLELEPDSVKARRLLASSYTAEGRHAEAVAVLEQAVDIKADSTSLRLALARSLRAMGKLQRARREIYKGLALRPDHLRLRAELKSVETDLNKRSGVN